MTYEVENTNEPPPCQCCGGSGQHVYRAYVGGASPDDDDIECSICQGTGSTWFDTHPRSCTGFKVLMRRSHRRY